MITVLLVIHLLIARSLVAVVLLQRSEGGGLGMGGGGGGMGGFMTGRAAASALTRATAILAGLFILTSLTLALLSEHGRGRDRNSIIGTPPPAQTAPSVPAAPAAPVGQ